MRCPSFLAAVSCSSFASVASGSATSNPACRHLTYRSSGRAKARCARLSSPLTSTLGPGEHRCLAPPLIQASSRYWFEALSIRTPARSAVPGSKVIGLVAKPLLAVHHLGHPSVGGRLTAGATGRISQGTAVLTR